MIAVDETLGKVLDMDSLAAPVSGVKVLEICWDCLSSPVVNTRWPPAPAYCAQNGIFFWALPKRWSEYLWISFPFSVVALVEVVPETDSCCQLSPALPNLTWPEYAPRIPPGADAICAHNMVAVARCLRIQKLVVSGSLTDSRLERLSEYAPLQLPYSGYPRLEVWVSGWRWFDELGRLIVDSGDQYVRLFAKHNFLTLDWRDRRTRGQVDEIVQEILAKE